MKTLKKTMWGVVSALVLLVIVGIIVTGMFLGDIVKKGVETVGPTITQVAVKVDEVHLSLWTGAASVKGLVVGNPEGYQSPQAISAGLIAVGVDPLSVFSDKIVVRSFQVESPEITFEGGLGGNNLGKIMDNVNAAAHDSAQTGSPASTNANTRTQSSKKLEVDDLLITGVKVHVILTGSGRKETTLSLPPIHLTDLGKNADGITTAELARSVLDAILTATLKAVSDAEIGKGAERLIKATGKNAGAGVSNIITQGLGKWLGK